MAKGCVIPAPSVPGRSGPVSDDDALRLQEHLGRRGEPAAPLHVLPPDVSVQMEWNRI